MLTITHTHSDGTLIDGTARGDGTAGILKERRWRWSRHLGTWYVPRSRDAAAKRQLIEATVADLRAEGHQVTVDIDDRWRDAATVDADRRARLSARAEALADKADRRAAEESAASAHAHELADRMPLGQPILVGHHSERAMRAAYDRIHAAQDRAVAACRTHVEADRKAVIAAAGVDSSHAPLVVANRIDRLAAETRKARRAHRPDAEVAHLEEQLGYWRTVRRQQVESGQVLDLQPQQVRVGDWVRVRGDVWWQVDRVNPTTLTLSAEISPTSQPMTCPSSSEVRHDSIGAIKQGHRDGKSPRRGTGVGSRARGRRRERLFTTPCPRGRLRRRASSSADRTRSAPQPGTEYSSMTSPHEVIVVDPAGCPVEVWCPTVQDWPAVEQQPGRLRCTGCTRLLTPAPVLSVTARTLLVCVEASASVAADVPAATRRAAALSTTSAASGIGPCAPRSPSGPAPTATTRQQPS